MWQLLRMVANQQTSHNSLMSAWARDNAKLSYSTLVQPNCVSLLSQKPTLASPAQLEMSNIGRRFIVTLVFILDAQQIF